MQRNERESREALQARQQLLLAELIADVRSRSAWWRQRIPDGPVELEQLAPISKEELTGGFDQMVTVEGLERSGLLEHLREAEGDTLLPGGIRVMATSGSSGVPGLFAYDPLAWRALLAQTVRATSWVGLKPSLPRRRLAAISASNPAHMTRRISECLDVGLHRVLRLGVTEPVERVIAALQEFQPDFLVTYPSLIGPLADAAEAGELRISPRAVQTISEPLTEGTRAQCERAFGQRPFDYFGSTEGLFGSECEQRDGMHLYEDCTIVEAVDGDGRPVADGEPATKLLVTNLFNRVLPLIRVELSDSVTIAAGPCACGRTLRRLQSLDGRANDVLELAGARVHPQHFGALGRDEQVRAYQVVQEGDGVRLRLVLASGIDAAATLARIEAEIGGKLAAAGVAEPRVRAEAVASLERSPGGKIKQVIAAPA
jgi:phenylacetate-CoA ligase